MEVSHAVVEPASSVLKVWKYGAPGDAACACSRLSSTSVTVTLYHRVDATTTNAFAVVPMTDDGLGGDAAAGDGLYSATLPARPNNTVVEFYIRAADLQGRVRTWPGPGCGVGWSCQASLPGAMLTIAFIDV